MEVRRKSHNGRPDASLAMEVRRKSHNGGAAQVAQRGARRKSGNGGAAQVPQWRCSASPTMEVRRKSHNGRPDASLAMEVRYLLPHNRKRPRRAVSLRSIGNAVCGRVLLTPRRGGAEEFRRNSQISVDLCASLWNSVIAKTDRSRLTAAADHMEAKRKSGNFHW